ncbi:MAG: hypothetical protein V4719_13380 [Planctomycetota bacterium]
MSRCLLVLFVGFSAIVMDDAANPAHAQGPYPRVVSPTGRFYGPTQAHYQYERQYGRPWYGGPAQFNPNTGVNINVQAGGWGGFHRDGGFYGGGAPFVDFGFAPFGGYGYGYGYGGPGYGGYAGVYQNQFGFVPMQQYQQIGPQGPQGMQPLFGAAPTFSWQQPDQLQQQPLQRPQPRGFGAPMAPQPNGGGPVGPAVPPEAVMARPHNFLPVPPSTVAQRQRSLHLQGQGDVWFRQNNYLQAYSRYKQAAAAAPDLAAPRFRMGYALMALKRFELAVPEFQRGIRLDPKYPLTGDSPTKIYGEENRLAAISLPQAVAAWVRQDIRSSDRLFLLGALLMINGDHVRARTLLETAAQFGAEGSTEHIVAFLRLEDAADGAPEQQPPADNADNRPPVPEAVEQMLKDDRNWLPPVVPPGKPAPKGLEVPQPQPAPATDAPATPEPAVPAVPVPKPAPAVVPPAVAEAGSGYQPIPKKGGAVPQPKPQPAEQEAPSGVQPAAQQAPDNDSGPVIPIPGSGK